MKQNTTQNLFDIEFHTICAHKECNNHAEYRAPKSPENLENYYWFCLTHIREYNQAWNYYKNMDTATMAQDQYNDLIGNRPTWLFGVQNNQTIYQNFSYETSSCENFKKPPKNIQSALQKMQLKLPITLPELKKHYKKLVKDLHPDIHGKNYFNENHLKEINDAYQLLKKWLC